MKNKIIRDIYTGKIDEYHLPEDLYLWTAKKLLKEANKGFFKEQFTGQIERPAEELIELLKRNIYVFSGAKTFQDVLDIKNIVYKEGFIRPFNEFKKEADKIFDNYNKNWLKVEQDLAWKQASSAKRWYDIQAEKDVLPMLKYVTAGDDRVRDEHAVLDGIIKKADDSFWDNYMPPNGFNCRCIAEQLEETAETPDNILKQKKKQSELPKLFKNNPGQTGYIFDEKAHPYFKVEDKYKLFKKRNFGLPIPKEL